MEGHCFIEWLSRLEGLLVVILFQRGNCGSDTERDLLWDSSFIPFLLWAHGSPPREAGLLSPGTFPEFAQRMGLLPTLGLLEPKLPHAIDFEKGF